MIPVIGTETHVLPAPYKDQIWNLGALVLNVEQMMVIVCTTLAMERFVVAAKQAGPNLTSDSFVKALETVKFAPDIFGTPESGFGPNKRQAFDMSRLSQIQNGQWKVISDWAR